MKHPHQHVLFASDVHLSERDQPTTEHFLRFLEEKARHADALYILGDLFDLWIGDDHDTPYNRRVVDALGELRRSNTALFFQRGNRDFLIGDGFARSTHCTLMEDHHVLDTGQEKLLLMHGDTLCWDDVDYQEFRKMVRSPRWRDEMLARALPEREALMGNYRSESTKRSSRKPSEITDVNQRAVEESMRTHRVHTLVHGHTHRPAEHRFELDGCAARRIVLGQWSHTSAMYADYREGSLQLSSY